MSIRNRIFKIGAMFVFILLLSNNAHAHCDTMEGPVIVAAKDALSQGNVNLVLIWVKPQYEKEIKDLFNQTVQIRKSNPSIQESADKNFFENLVRIHRAGEGAPYTGIKEEKEMNPAVTGTDHAIETGNPGELMKILNEGIEKGLKERFDALMARKTYNKNNVSEGREYVESYVSLVHYAEGIYNFTSNRHEHHEEKHSDAKHEGCITSGEHAHGSIRSQGHDHVSHILIIVSALLIISVQIITTRRKMQ